MSRNPVQIDCSQSRAILKEVGERLRDHLGEAPAANPSLERQLALFDALDDSLPRRKPIVSN